jgi:ankyrin repeat protein
MTTSRNRRSLLSGTLHHTDITSSEPVNPQGEVGEGRLRALIGVVSTARGCSFSSEMKIHTYAQQGDIDGVARELASGVGSESTDDRDSYTPLMSAAASPHASADMVRFLIERGANVNAVGGDSPESLNETVLELAVRGRDVEKVRLLLDAGANLHYVRPSNYDVLTDAMCRWEISHDETLVPILNLLIERGARTNGESDYGESALRIASRVGRFDVVGLLLQAGADSSQLKWTALMEAVALGSLQTVERRLAEGADLAARDFWNRTPWLLSLQTGDVDKAKGLLAAGADRQDRGHCGRTVLMYPIESGHVPMLAWLIEERFDLDAVNDFGDTPLMTAAEHGETECARLLIEAGADTAAVDHLGQRAIKHASNLEIVRLLVDAGEDLNDVDDEIRALMTGVDYEGELQSSAEDYRAGKHPRFGTANPEVMHVEFWNAMVRSGVTAWRAREAFDNCRPLDDGPVWCFHRFGKSITELPGGRFVEIAGESEDFYDPDFCIYNDVIVHHGGGRFDILGYPKEVFPPTDFHSATLVGSHIYIIGCIGYRGERMYGETPVYRLSCETFAIEKIEATGEKPGWISGHRACLESESEIHLSGGKVCCMVDGKEEYPYNPNRYALDLARMTWRRIGSR